ncbi:MAG: metallophosphoesterase [Pyrinomonadaceae bacterium]
MARLSSTPQKPMVGWYAPAQLAKTAVEVAISTIFGRHSDHRLVEAMASSDDQKKVYDYTYAHLVDEDDPFKPDLAHPRDSIWIDYVGDVGDGWNSTYAIAYYLAEPGGRTFKYEDRDSDKKYEAETKKGEILIFGGDEVYPTASRQEYNDRLVAPYETALRNSPKPYPHVFAIPGNHDWYDSLVAFTRVFTARTWFAGWRTRQARSYFALKLPHNWWLLGTDVQLGSDIDKPQMDYFVSLKSEMDEQSAKTSEPARIIVCHAEPHWIREAQYGGDDPAYSESNLKLLERKLGKSVAVFIAGDLHHYRRHEEVKDKSTQKITAGGGGAFLHPTHVGRLGGTSMDMIVEKGLEDEERQFKQAGCFPSTKDSRNLTWRNLTFPFFFLKGNQSWTFGLLTAALYLLLTLVVGMKVGDPSLNLNPGHVVGVAIESMRDSPLTFLLAVLTFVGFLFFTDTHKKLHRFFGGGLHALLHIFSAFYIAVICVALVGNLPASWRLPIPWPAGFNFHLNIRMVLAWVMIFVLGFFVGSFIMGLYLLVSLNIFGRHGNEAFSSLGIEDWKNFLRLHINGNGDLTIYPIGIKRVPRKWKPGPSKTGPELIPDPEDANATAPELIEPPIVMKTNRATATGCQTTSPDMKIDSETQSSQPSAS